MCPNDLSWCQLTKLKDRWEEEEEEKTNKYVRRVGVAVVLWLACCTPIEKSGFETYTDHCVAFLSKLFSPIVFLSNQERIPAEDQGSPMVDRHSTQWRILILLATSCNGNQDKRQLGGLLASSTDLTKYK